MAIGSDIFLADSYQSINKARLEHLASLGLAIAGTRVLEVGAGIGDHSPFFLERGCELVSTDARPENVEIMRQRFPDRAIAVLDLDTETDLSRFGSFDIVYCYGTLYHLALPEHALQLMAQVCTGMILLETCVTPGDDAEIHAIAESVSMADQAFSGMGCRPTRPWLMAMLRQYYGHAYVTQHQPCHPQFILDWQNPPSQPLYRSVFVGSRQPLTQPTLCAEVPAQQTYEPQLRTDWARAIVTSPDWQERLNSLNPDAVAELAAAIAISRPLSPDPGWNYEWEFASSDLPTQQRCAIWQYFQTRQIEIRIQMPWYHDLQIFQYLPTEFSALMFISGGYEPNEFYLLDQILQPGMVVLDIGANEGLYSLFAARKVGTTGLVVAFEPSTREVRRLQDNLALNPSVSIKLCPLALSNTTGNAQLKVADSEFSGHNTFGEFVWDATLQQVETVAVRRLDEVVQEWQLSRVDVIKIDVEGAEPLVLAGGQAVLETFHPLLLLELSDRSLTAQGSSAARVVADLQALGYQLFSFGQATGLPIPLQSSSGASSNVIAVYPGQLLAGFGTPEQLAERMQTEVDYLRSRHLQTQAQLATLQTAQAESRTQLDQAQTYLHAKQQELGQTQVLLAQATDRIAAMESSKFWQLRQGWFKLKRLLNLPGQD